MPAPAAALLSALSAGLLCSVFAGLALGTERGSPPAAAATQASSSRSQNEEAAARNLYREANELKAAGRLSQALEKYREAYQSLPTPTLLWPIAELSLQLDQPVEGLEALHHYQKSMSPALMEPGQQIADAERLEKQLHERLGNLRFAGGNGALVTLDGRELGRAPISEPLTVNPGSHRIDRALGRSTQTAVVQVNPGAELWVDLKDGLHVTAGSGKGLGVGTTSYRPHPLPVVLVGVSLGMLTVATVLGGLALDKTTTLNTKCPDHLCRETPDNSLGTLNDLVVAQHSFSTAAIALWGVGGVVLAGGLVLLAVDAQRFRSGHRLWTLAPQLEVSARGVSLGLGLGGRF